MDLDDLIQALKNLASTDHASLRDEATYRDWQAKSLSLLKAAFGPTSDLVHQFADKTDRPDRSPSALQFRKDFEVLRADAATQGTITLWTGLMWLETNRADLIDPPMDPELSAHVQELIHSEDWAKIPAAVAIFVEDKVRRWAGDPRQSNGDIMIGKVLYATTLKDDGPLRLGGQTNEHEGWRFLGQGLAQAVGNVDRHRIQRRADAKRYAMGVLGLGSLLLTQLRYEHPAQIQEADSLAEVADEDDSSTSPLGGGGDPMSSAQ